MSFLCSSSGQRKPEPIVLHFPPRHRHEVRVEREVGGEGWVVLTPAREHAWLCGDFATAMSEARALAAELGISIWSSDWRNAL
jgi:hypothetical protein